MKHKKHKMQITSLTSYEELKDTLGEKQLFVLKGFKNLSLIQGDATDMEVARFLNTDTNVVRPRRYELVNEFKLIGINQKRACRITKKMAIAWKLNIPLVSENLKGGKNENNY